MRREPITKLIFSYNFSIITHENIGDHYCFYDDDIFP